MGRLRERLARLEAGVSEQDELETITWADGATLTLPRRRITEILLKASTGRSSFPVWMKGPPTWDDGDPH